MADAEHGRPNQTENEPPTPNAFPVDRNGDEANTRREREKQHERADSRRQIWMIFFTALIAGATIIYAVVSARQLIAMDGQLRALNNQLWEQKHEDWATSNQLRGQLVALNGQVSAQSTTAAAAKSAADTAAKALGETKTDFSQQLRRLDETASAQLKAANATRDNATAAQKSLAASERSFIIEQRPWVGASLNGTMQYDADKSRLGVYAKVENAGRSPANDIVVSARFFFGVPAMPQIDAFFLHQPRTPNPGGQRFILLPGDNSGEFVYANGATQNYANWAMTTDASAYVAMRVWYKDEFKRQYSVDYCVLWFQTIKNWTSCLRHNEQHDPEEQPGQSKRPRHPHGRKRPGEPGISS